jgi:putative transposase
LTSNYNRPNKPVLHRPLEPAQYTSIRFTETLALQRLSASIGSVGDAYDNAVAESFMGLFKNEAIAAGSPFRTGPLRTLADVEAVTMNYVDWYNNHRLHSLHDLTTPEEFEQTYYAHQTGSPSGAAANKKTA